MRIDLYSGGRRPWPARIFLRVWRWWVGVDVGPPTAMSYRPDLFPLAFVRYLMGALRGSPSWDRGHVEMIAAFVSRANSCSF